jgi:pyruvate kinase
VLEASHPTPDALSEAAGRRIIERTKRHKMYRSIINASQPGEEETAPHAVTAAAADLAAALRASAVVAFTTSGTTAARIAPKRPRVSMLAVTPDQRVSRQFCLLWRAHSVLSTGMAHA